jgi:hypothetical protein
MEEVKARKFLVSREDFQGDLIGQISAYWAIGS